MRLAIVSPLPPSPTGIADYTVEVVRALGVSHGVELFHDQDEVSPSLPAPVFRVDELQERAAYDSVIYQMGNAPAHDFMYDWMERVPGVVILHDLVLHHSYARRYLESPESLSYAADPSSEEKRRRAEEKHRLYENAIDVVYPGLGERLRDAHFNSTGDLLPYAYPLFEPALLKAKAVGAHNSFMVEAVRNARPDLPCLKIAMPVEPATAATAAIDALRARLRIEAAQPIVGCFGLLTREKRIETVARALARIAEVHPGVRLLLVGAVNDAPWLNALLERTEIAKRTIIAGRLPDEEFTAAIGIADAVVHLRYPTARETSAALLRVMAQGRPAIISDIANQSEIPDDAVKRVDSRDEEGDLARGIDWILGNPEAARAMGERARRFVSVEHSPARTRASYERLLKSSAPLYSQARP